MHYYLTGVLTVLMILSAQGDEYRIFTDAQGRAIEAKIIAYDSSKAKIRIERKDGGAFWVAPSLFSQEDLKYIKEWVKADQILSDDNLRIAFKKKTKTAKKKDSEGKLTFNGTELQYEITLNNRAADSLDSLRVDYCYFIQKRSRENTIGDWTIRRVKGSATLQRINARASTTILTKTETFGDEIAQVRVVDTYKGFTGYDEKKVSEEEIMGVWLRISGPKVGGEPVYRDVCYPAELAEKVTWEE